MIEKNEPFLPSEHRRFASRQSHLTLKGAENVPNQGKSKCIVRTMNKENKPATTAVSNHFNCIKVDLIK